LITMLFHRNRCIASVHKKIIIIGKTSHLEVWKMGRTSSLMRESPICQQRIVYNLEKKYCEIYIQLAGLQETGGFDT
jgi:DNA-binding transcriptional regulator/RsmH inhibitor MraZ